MAREAAAGPKRPKTQRAQRAAEAKAAVMESPEAAGGAVQVRAQAVCMGQSSGHPKVGAAGAACRGGKGGEECQL